MDILKNRINIFSVETSFCQFSNMASSGLKKMFILQYYIHKNVYQKMSSPTLSGNSICHLAITSAIT